MKKFLTALLVTVMSLGFICFAGCTDGNLYEKYRQEIDKEMKGCFDFFWNEASVSENTAYSGLTYGLIADRAPNTGKNGSTASVGFGLTAYAIGVEEGWVEREEAEERSVKTMRTIKNLQSLPDVSYEGFLAHFISMETGERYGKCEISSVDTAILLCGVLSAGEYFGGEAETLANEIYSNVNWKALEVKKGSKSYISMGYNPDTQKVLSANWDWYAEQLMIYVLGAGSPKAEYRLDDKAYYDFKRETGEYGGEEFIYSWFGSIFTYQFSHAWIDFSGKTDKNGTDWFENSVKASEAAYKYCKDNSSGSKTFAGGGWGLTACDAPGGYSGKLGTPPRGWNSGEDPNYSRIEGTVAPCGALGSVVFTPKESLEALKLYQSIRLINDKYGLADAYNLDRDFYASDYIGIDKGITLLMLSNYKSKTVWNIFMENENVLLGLDNLGFTEAL